jgi:hypothetical protein
MRVRFSHSEGRFLVAETAALIPAPGVVVTGVKNLIDDTYDRASQRTSIQGDEAWS